MIQLPNFLWVQTKIIVSNEIAKCFDFIPRMKISILLANVRAASKLTLSLSDKDGILHY